MKVYTLKKTVLVHNWPPHPVDICPLAHGYMASNLVMSTTPPGYFNTQQCQRFRWGLRRSNFIDLTVSSKLLSFEWAVSMTPLLHVFRRNLLVPPLLLKLFIHDVVKNSYCFASANHFPHTAEQAYVSHEFFSIYLCELDHRYHVPGHVHNDHLHSLYLHAL